MRKKIEVSCECGNKVLKEPRELKRYPNILATVIEKVVVAKFVRQATMIELKIKERKWLL